MAPAFSAPARRQTCAISTDATQRAPESYLPRACRIRCGLVASKTCAAELRSPAQQAFDCTAAHQHLNTWRRSG
jgi:hypothetical protein